MGNFLLGSADSRTTSKRNTVCLCTPPSLSLTPHTPQLSDDAGQTMLDGCSAHRWHSSAPDNPCLYISPLSSWKGFIWREGLELCLGNLGCLDLHFASHQVNRVVRLRLAAPRCSHVSASSFYPLGTLRLQTPTHKLGWASEAYTAQGLSSLEHKPGDHRLSMFLTSVAWDF